MNDLTGQRFGRILVVDKADNPKKDGALWNCICDCGQRFIGRGNSMKGGRKNSCGCRQMEVWTNKKRVHGATAGGRPSPEYRSYAHMLERCNNSKHHQYKDYGGRGIMVCDRWRSNFAAFLADMGQRPLGTTLDRIENSRGYEPGNCRWATRKEQNQNSRNVLAVIRSDGVRYPSITEAMVAVSGSWHPIKKSCLTGHPYRGYTWAFQERTA